MQDPDKMNFMSNSRIGGPHVFFNDVVASLVSSRFRIHQKKNTHVLRHADSSQEIQRMPQPACHNLLACKQVFGFSNVQLPLTGVRDFKLKALIEKYKAKTDKHGRCHLQQSLLFAPCLASIYG